jgi:hypothetical protein
MYKKYPITVRSREQRKVAYNLYAKKGLVIYICSCCSTEYWKDTNKETVISCPSCGSPDYTKQESFKVEKNRIKVTYHQEHRFLFIRIRGKRCTLWV